MVTEAFSRPATLEDLKTLIRALNEHVELVWVPIQTFDNIGDPGSRRRGVRS